MFMEIFGIDDEKKEEKLKCLKDVLKNEIISKEEFLLIEKNRAEKKYNDFFDEKKIKNKRKK